MGERNWVSLASCLEHTDKGRESLGAALILGTVRDLASDDRRSKNPFRPVIGRFDSGLKQKPQQVASVVLTTDPVQ